MTPEQINMVRAAFEKVHATAESTAALLYVRLFELNPRLQTLFKGNMQEQGQKVMDMFYLAATSLDQADKIAPTFERLGRSHGEYGVKPEDYLTMSAAMDWTLEMTLGDDFTPELKTAWHEAYAMLVEMMQAANGGDKVDLLS
jgi:hemoglobin-like flavoprotein